MFRVLGIYNFALAPKFEARVESLNSSLKLGANVESSEKLIIRVDFLLVS